MTARTVWLASFPKSGNTWVRAILTALDVHSHLFAANRLGHGGQPYGVAGSLQAWGIDARWLSRDELDRMRASMVVRTGQVIDGMVEDEDGNLSDQGAALPKPLLRKTHEVYRSGKPGREPFPLQATRAAIHIVRDPRDVACSYAPFFGVDLDGAVEAMGTGQGDLKSSPAGLHTAQPWGSWTEHFRSWRVDDVPFPVHLVRYEDLKRDAVSTLEPVLTAIGLDVTRDQLADAVHQARFERLRDMEENKNGFREVSRHTEVFFRKGQSGAWREELSPAQVAAIEADHGDVMRELGYELETSEADRRALAESRASVRRQRTRRWDSLPERLGLEIGEGSVPDEIDGAVHVRPWLQTTQTASRVQFTSGDALLVENGRTVTVQWNSDEDPGDRSWMIQGWAVTLATMQRGGLSLHASTVRVGDAVVAVAGHRGAGKSTTAMALRARGHSLLIDDVTLIENRDEGAFTTPFSRNVHLLPDAAENVGVDFDALPMLAGGRDKGAFRAEDPDEVPHRIDVVFVLQPRPSGTELTAIERRGAERLPALAPHISRDGLAPHILGAQAHFDALARLADSVRVVVIRRPRGTMTLDAVVALIEEHAVPSPQVASGAIA